MGSFVELNDTLQITTEQGFPASTLDLQKHQKKPISLDSVKDKVFEFHDKESARIFHLAPTRVFLVHNIGGKWLYWGKAIMLEQTIKWDGKNHKTSGKYKIIQIYSPDYQIQITKNETNPGKSYF
ncbi:MAG: hypothetical protein PHH08_00380 [Candidatus ainarchaeum sp.]|nr:hypothetical protein [Candidatus ainarchaeum sp.]